MVFPVSDLTLCNNSRAIHPFWQEVQVKKRFVAEMLGTFVLVFGGCGSAVFAAGTPGVGIGWLGVSLAFGLTVLVCVYAIGSVSGCHLNPAVSVGLAVAGRFSSKDLLPYIVAQVLGGIVAAAALLFLLQQAPGGYDAAAGGLAANGYGAHSPGQYSMVAGFAAEVILTFIFLFVILGATSKAAPAAMAGIAIGLCLTLVHLIGIPITNLSVNPARSTGPAIFVGGWALAQLWLFWVAPILGGALAGLTSKWLFAPDET
jgi:aquaporin Z